MLLSIYDALVILVEVHMKKSLVILLIMACMASTSACAKPYKSAGTMSFNTTVDSTEEPETTTDDFSESEFSGSTFEETTETTTETTTTEATTTSSVTQTAKAKPTVKVTTADKKTINTGGGNKLKVSIPKVTISGKNMSSVNSKIKKDINKKQMGASYSYYTNDKIVSILIRYEGEYDTERENRVYNISVSTGKFMSDSAVVKLAGSTDKKFLAKVKKAYKKSKFGTGDVYNKKEASKLLSKIRTRNLKRVSYKYVDPYIDSKGKLKWVSSYYWYNIEMGDIALAHT